MKTLIAAALLLALASPASAETCTGRVKIDAMKNELAGGRIAYVGECMFLPEIQKRVLRSCPAGSYCRVEGVSYGEGEVAPEINAFTRVTRVTRGVKELTATPAQWKDIRTLQIAFFRCGGATDDPELKEACDLSSKLQDKLAKQGFCTYKHILVGRRAWRGPEEDRVYSGAKGEKHCYALHEPAR